MRAKLLSFPVCSVSNLFLFLCSVELDFKQQEDKLQPLMKRLCSAEDSPFPSLPYPQEAYTSTPKRKAKAEAKKHARWKLWFLWKNTQQDTLSLSLHSLRLHSPFLPPFALFLILSWVSSFYRSSPFLKTDRILAGLQCQKRCIWTFQKA